MPGGLRGRAAIKDAPLRISDRSAAPPECNGQTEGFLSLTVAQWTPRVGGRTA